MTSGEADTTSVEDEVECAVAGPEELMFVWGEDSDTSLFILNLSLLASEEILALPEPAGKEFVAGEESLMALIVDRLDTGQFRVCSINLATCSLLSSGGSSERFMG